MTNSQNKVEIIFVNGPPRSGKDTVGALLVQHSPRVVRTMKFAKELKDRVHLAYKLFNSNGGGPIPTEIFDAVKDQPQEFFFGKTPREVYIAFSEDFMKPTHGEGIFGRMLLQNLKRGIEQEAAHLPENKRTEFIVITDSGFRCEAEPIIEHFGAENCRLLQLQREGCSFDNDSRNYIHLEDLGIVSHYIVNPENDIPGLLATLKETLADVFLSIVR